MIAVLEEIEEKDADAEGEELELHDGAQGHAVLDDGGDGNLHVKEITNGDITMVVAKEEVTRRREMHLFHSNQMIRFGFQKRTLLQLSWNLILNRLTTQVIGAISSP